PELVKGDAGGGDSRAQVRFTAHAADQSLVFGLDRVIADCGAGLGGGVQHQLAIDKGGESLFTNGVGRLGATSVDALGGVDIGELSSPPVMIRSGDLHSIHRGYRSLGSVVTHVVLVEEV